LNMSSDHAPFALRLFRYKSGTTVFGQGSRGSWKEAWLALYDDDTLIWFNDKHCSKICGQIKKFTSTSMPFLKVGRVAEREAVHLRPHRPEWATADEAFYLALPKPNKKTWEWYWFYTKKDSDLLSCLLHFAQAAGKEREFRVLIEGNRIVEHQKPFETKYKRFGASLKGDMKLAVLKEDIGLIWQTFALSLSSTAIEESGAHENQGFEAETKTTQKAKNDAEFVPSETEQKLEPVDDFELHDGGYYSSRTNTLDSAPQNSKADRSDSEKSTTEPHFSTTVSVEIHSDH